MDWRRHCQRVATAGLVSIPCALLAQAVRTKDKRLEIRDEVRPFIVRRLWLEPSKLTRNALIDPLACAWIHG